VRTAEQTDDGRIVVDGFGAIADECLGIRSLLRAALASAYARLVGDRGFIAPMLLTATGAVPADAAWALEPKLDGCRGQLHVTATGSVRVRSRPGRDCRAEFPELAAAAGQTGGRDVILDGELISLDANGRPDFDGVRRRFGLRRHHEIARAAASRPVAFVAFDALAVSGNDLCALPYSERRLRLTDAICSAGPVSVIPSYNAAIDDVATATRALGLEGVVAKRLQSRYLPGRRSRSWLKHKHWRTEQLIVTGWRPAARREPDTVFLARVSPDGTLTYAGNAAYGLDRQRPALLRALEAHERPTRNRSGIRSVAPVISVEVDHHGRVGEGPLRDPVMRSFATHA
jgi:bifunctional non-homologous end joining protein LigD